MDSTLSENSDTTDPDSCSGGVADELRAFASTLLGRSLTPGADDTSLFELGLQSLQLMRFVGRLRRAGRTVGFAELAADPTITAWARLLGDGPTAEPRQDRPARAPEHDGPTGDAPFPLTPVQQAYWVGRGDDQLLGGVGCHAYLEFETTGVDVARLGEAFRALLARHPMLRAVFAEDGTQTIAAESSWSGPEVHDLRASTSPEAESALRRLREGLSHRRFQVSRGEVVDLQVSRLPGGDRLHLDVDLLVCDVHSIRVLLADLAALYDGRRLPELGLTFADYLRRRAAAEGPARAVARDYWQARLADLPGGPRLPLAVEPGRLDTTRFTRRIQRLSPREWAALGQRAAACGVTSATLLLTAYAEILSRWSGDRRFLVNIPLFDRDREVHPDVAHLIADFTSLTLLDVDLDAAGDFAGRARAIQRRLHADLDHSAYNGVEVLRDLLRADPDSPRTAPVVFACNVDAPLVPAAFADRFGDHTFMLSQTPQVWLDNQVYLDRDGGLTIAWDAVEDLFPDRLLDQMQIAYAGLLRSLITAEWAGEPAIGLPETTRRRRAEVNGSTRAHSGLRLHDGFFVQAARDPGRPALLWGDHGRLSYGELADRACRIGAALRARGVGRGDTVLVNAPKGPDQITAVLGVLAAGAVYVPVGVDQPALRRDRIAAVCGAAVVLTAGPAALDDSELTIAEALRERPAAPVAGEPGDTAYVIFTSGSTGEPKGVQISHRAAVNTVEDVNERFALRGDDRVLAVSALDFDLSVWDIFGLLSVGGAVALVAEDERRDAAGWLRLCARHRVTVWNSVPALMDMLLTAAEPDPLPPTLRLALLSGDWIGLDLPERLAKQTGGRCRLVALGGATEAAIWSNACVVESVPAHWRSIPYGTPLRNQSYRVVDPVGRDCPDWVPGELWIGGDGVADGYRGDPDLTARRFVQRNGRRWYRTGDLGRYWPDGTLEFLGRVDQQIKVNGFRVELGEVEAVLVAHPSIARAVVVADGERNHRLSALVVEETPTTDPAPPPGPAAEPSAGGTDAAAATLTALLAGLGAGGDPTPIAGLPVSARHSEALHAWLDLLSERGRARVEAGMIHELRRPAETPGGADAETTSIDRARPLLAAVLAGTADPAALLDDPALSPEGVHLPGVADCLRAAGRVVGAAVTAPGATGLVVEYAAHGGRTADLLMAGHPGGGSPTYVTVSRFPEVPAAARTRLAGAATVRGEDGTTVPDDLLHRADIGLINDAFALTSPAEALAGLRPMLRPGARVLVVAGAADSTSALVLGPLLRGPGSRRTDAPVASWLAGFATAGFTVREIVSAGQGAALLTACLDETAPVVAADRILDWAAARLPGHMVPARLVVTPALPLNANGKVDRGAALRLASAAAVTAAAPAAPQGHLEEAVAELWRRSLGLTAVGRHDNFFRSGGDSVLATRMLADIRATFGTALPMADVLRAPTVAGMCRLITERSGAGATEDIESGVL
ncbi:amino acid adenylation domain-containing protein [Actinoplanes oblitus]|uniref:Phenyloxazoline synthase MbtB n=1 Tax=Actinoplanes oblitus TaxID=3040509 RepID=A0ABY8WTP3_9ACTN|nr:amino acid adenylation domain-containing protein [Actinoplanes oblitus]WIN00833.1 amino acid adenylation domain-containing protein [Actinoplanes oblitus]